MIIPKHLREQEMTEEVKRMLIKFVKQCRERIDGLKRYDTKEEAIKAALAVPLSTVWREPRDVGTKFFVAPYDKKEFAYNAGCKEIVNESTMADMQNESVDEIVEV